MSKRKEADHLNRIEAAVDKLPPERREQVQLELAAKADGEGRHLNADQITDMLEGIRDHSLQWWAECVEAKQGKGLLAAQVSFECAVNELNRFNEGGTTGTRQIELVIPGFDPSRMVVTPPPDVEVEVQQ